jgi:hypothetical protein
VTRERWVHSKELFISSSSCCTKPQDSCDGVKC